MLIYICGIAHAQHQSLLEALDEHPCQLSPKEKSAISLGVRDARTHLLWSILDVFVRVKAARTRPFVPREQQAQRIQLALPRGQAATAACPRQPS
jgi:hypothetical protein